MFRLRKADGSGQEPSASPSDSVQPVSKNVLLDGFKIRESPFWTIHMYMCDGGIARNLDVKAHGHNNDGIDLEMTRNFLIEDCTFDQGDDAVVIKAGRNRGCMATEYAD